MLQKKTMPCCWGMGLSPDQATLLQKLLANDHPVVLFDEESDLPSRQDFENAPACLLWLSASYCKKLLQMPREQRQHLDHLPKALLLEEGYSLADFEIACDLGISKILRPPLTRKQIAAVMRHMLEAQVAQYDIYCMTREIMLERELLERKNELLNFLVNFLANTTERLDLEYLFQTAFDNLSSLLPMRGLHAVLWERDRSGNPALSLYISAPENGKAYGLWRETLLEKARLALKRSCSIQEVSRLRLSRQSGQWLEAAPEDGSLICLPIASGNEQHGVLLLLASMERPLGRDQAMALDSAMRHFSLSIKNALRFRVMQMHADYDALTKIHSRRHFEGRVEEEIQRFLRYGQNMSLIILDIDYFKKINDTRGHHVGDIVLRQVAALIQELIRTADYCARYGGEEFIILLPHTGGQDAVTLAERIRKKIARHNFLVPDGPPVKLTVSMGVASLVPGIDKDKQCLVCEADAALYTAKQSGRNRTCDCFEETACHAN